MKNVVSLVLFLIVSFIQLYETIAQVRYVSRVDPTTVSTITVERENKQISYSIKLEFNADTSIKCNVFDHDSLLSRESDRIINKSDKDYFFIPFDNNNPEILLRQNAFCIECGCHGGASSGGTCTATSTFGLACLSNGCSCCAAVIRNCATHVFSKSGGVFIYGTSCVKDDTVSTFVSQISDSTASKILLKYDVCTDTYIYSISSIALESGIKPKTYNLTVIDFTKKIFFVESNSKYWFIPAIQTYEPFPLRQSAYYCIMCACDGSGTCGEGSGGGTIWCDATNCNCCQMYILWCDDYSARINYGGGILVKSQNVKKDI